MVLLSQAMRTAAFTGRTDSMFTRIAGRQGGKWAEQTVGAAFPPAGSGRPTRPSRTPARRAVDSAAQLRDLTDLRDRGLLTDSEFDRLRARSDV